MIIPQFLFLYKVNQQIQKYYTTKFKNVENLPIL